MENALFCASALFDLKKSVAAPFFIDGEPVWSILSRLDRDVEALGRSLPGCFIETGASVWIHREAAVSESARIEGPAIVCEGAVLRVGCYIRGPAVIGRNAVVGNSTEIKNAILFDGSQAPHFNYVGDSVLGAKAHMGAGAILSNLRLDGKNITIKIGEKRIETGLRKFGALLGDGVQLGCNSVCNPGTIVGKNAFICPLVNAGGIIPGGSVVKR